MAARAADLGSGRPGRPGAGDELVNRRRRDARCEPLAVVPLGGDLPADFVPVRAVERRSHGHGRIADAFEAVEDVPVAVGVALGDFPVVRAGVPRCSGIHEHNPLFELTGIDVDCDARYAGDAEFDGGDASVQGWPVVLHAGRHANGLALDVHGHLQQVLGIRRSVRPACKRAAAGDGQRRRPRDAGTRRRFSTRGQRRVLETVVPGEMRQQR